MLSPNSIPAKRTQRASSTWSNDSGYGSGIHEDARLSSILGSRDITSGQPSVPQPVSLGIHGLAKLQLDDQVTIKEEEYSCGLDTPRLRNPDDDHFQHFHRIGDCLCKDAEERTFGRPDHLQQHAKNFHKMTQPLSELVRDTWRIDGPGLIVDKIWSCGFCQEVLYTWDARQTHIALHFKNGSTMAEWRTSRSTLPGIYSSSNESTALDALASMGTTIAGPSTQRPYQVSNTNVGAPSFQLQSASTTAFMPTSTGIPDLIFDPFYGWGNPIDTFIPSTTDLIPAYSHTSMMPTAAHGTGDPSMNHVCVGYDSYGNPLYDQNSWSLQ
ncbi:hypothetical protein N0V95_009623 [Ascochyta clinopodiicola]|nr:hypothetical protein N0V95_009623 [Ascochyta clinopodiicola]